MLLQLFVAVVTHLVGLLVVDAIFDFRPGPFLRIHTRGFAVAKPPKERRQFMLIDELRQGLMSISAAEYDFLLSLLRN